MIFQPAVGNHHALDQQLRQSTLFNGEQLLPQARQISHRKHDLRPGQVWAAVRPIPKTDRTMCGADSAADLLGHSIPLMGAAGSGPKAGPRAEAPGV
ncbi:MAG: hypothetical protein R3E56_16615 [Burkholderiaceae bacterium]